MDILVLPSIEDESFGRVIVEGMALGVPVIGSKTGGIPEIILHKKNGLLFEMGSSQDLSKNIELLINDNKLKDQIIKNGNRTFFKNFFVKAYVNNYYNIIN